MFFMLERILKFIMDYKDVRIKGRGGFVEFIKILTLYDVCHS